MLEDSPDSLVNLCSRAIVYNPSSCLNACSVPATIGNLICDKFREVKLNEPKVTPSDCEQFFKYFNPKNLPLTRINFSSLPISSRLFDKFLSQYINMLEEINIMDCPLLVRTAMTILNCHLGEVDIYKVSKRNGRKSNKEYYEEDDDDNDDIDNNHDDDYDDDDDDDDDDDNKTNNHDNNYNNSNYETNYDDEDEDIEIYCPPYFDLRVKIPRNSRRKLETSSSSLNLSSPVKMIKIEQDSKQQSTRSSSRMDEKIKTVSSIKSLILGRTNDKGNETIHIQIYANDLKLSERLQLTKLVVNNYKEEFGSLNIRDKTNMNHPSLKTIEHLDISFTTIDANPKCLNNFTKLRELILYQVKYENPTITMRYLTKLPNLRQLRVLDLSRTYDNESQQRFSNFATEEPDFSIDLVDILLKLDKLQRLDVSGQTLEIKNLKEYEEYKNIPNKEPLDFLGLFRTKNSAFYRAIIPALNIASDKSEKELLTACREYLYRPDQLYIVLSDLNNHYRCVISTSSTTSLTNSLDSILPILSTHLNDEGLMELATQTLWWIIKLDVTSRCFRYPVRKVIISRCLDVMHRYKDNKSILFNGVYPLVLSPDIVCEHIRVATISLYMSRNKDPRTQSWGITLLNTLACQVNRCQKENIGRYCGIDTMISIIKDKVENDCCDEILETAWSFLWNVTDETPYNCDRFIKIGGLEAFEQCINKFNDSSVLRNIMGLLGNVAEVSELRPYFMTNNYIEKFHFLLLSDIDGIECSYNACGILAHLVAEGPDYWNKFAETLTIPRVCILLRMRDTISNWPINRQRNINYRSLVPIVKLLSIDIDVESQYWAVWALTNLTRVNPDKYCPMLISNGLKELENLLYHRQFHSELKNLCEVCLYQLELYETGGNVRGLETSSLVSLESVKLFSANYEPMQVIYL